MSPATPASPSVIDLICPTPLQPTRSHSSNSSNATDASIHTATAHDEYVYHVFRSVEENESGSCGFDVACGVYATLEEANEEARRALDEAWPGPWADFKVNTDDEGLISIEAVFDGGATADCIIRKVKWDRHPPETAEAGKAWLVWAGGKVLSVHQSEPGALKAVERRVLGLQRENKEEGRKFVLRNFGLRGVMISEGADGKKAREVVVDAEERDMMT